MRFADASLPKFPPLRSRRNSWTGGPPLFIIIAPLPSGSPHLGLANAASYPVSQRIACCLSPPARHQRRRSRRFNHGG